MNREKGGGRWLPPFFFKGILWYDDDDMSLTKLWVAREVS